MKLSNKTILIVSNEPWGDVWYSKHNWAYALSKTNKVYFIQPPEKWSFKNIFTSNITISKHSKNLIILTYNNRLPYTRFSFFFKINELFISKSIKNYFIQSPFVFWSFDPIRLIKPQRLKPIISIYFAADYMKTKKEKILSANSDYNFSVNKKIVEELYCHPSKKLVLSHGIHEVKPIKKENIKNQVVLMTLFSDRINYNLLQKLINKFPNQKFYLFGNNNILETNNKLMFHQIVNSPNVDYKGPKKYADIEPYFKQAKLALAIYNTDNITNSLNSLKIIQYLSYGLSIVTTPFEDYKEAMKLGLLNMKKNESEFIEQCSTILNAEINEELIYKRVNYAKQFLYSNLILNIESFLASSNNK